MTLPQKIGPTAPQTADHKYYAPPAEELPFRELCRKLWRQKLVILAAAMALTVAAAIIIFLIQPEYTAVARVVIDAHQPDYRPSASGDAKSNNLYVDGQVIETQIQIIRSRGVIEQVIDQLHLDERPEFNERLRPPTFLKHVMVSVLRRVRGALDALGIEAPSGLTDVVDRGYEPPQIARTRLVEAVKDKLDVAEEGLSSVIRVAFTSQDPEIAALAANAVTQFYIEDQLAVKAKSAKNANDWVNQRVAELRQEVQRAELAVQDYIEQQGLIKTKEGTPAAQEIAQLSAEMARAQADRAVAEARLQQLTSLLNSPKGLENASEVIGSPLIIHLRQQEAQLQNKAAELSQIYGELNPKMVDIKAAIADIENKIRAEAERIIEAMRNDVSVARARERSIGNRLDASKRELAQLDNSEVRLRPLQREAEASRNLFEAFLMRSKQIVDQAQNSDAHVLAAASVPEKPSFPKRRALLLLSFTGALFIGVLIALWIDHLDPGFRSLEQAQSFLGLRPLALIPSLGTLKSIQRANPPNYMISKPRSRYGEAIRTIIIGLSERARETRRAKILLVSSSLPSEGKTSLVLSLARFLAESNQRVLVVDCDLRRPAAHRAFEAECSPGLSEYLLGEADPESIIRRDKHSAAELVSAGEGKKNPTMLLNSPRMRRLLRELAGSYDWIILDSSPVMAVADARLLATLADKTLFVVRWAKTRRETASLAVTRLQEAGADIAGLVLSRVDVRRHSKYSYSDPAYQRAGVAKYYVG